MVSDRPFPMLGRPLHDGRKVKLMRVGLSACRRERARSLHNGMEARVDIPVEALVKAFTSHTRLLRDLPHTLRFGHIADYAGTEIEPQRAGPVTNRMQVTHRPPHLEAQSESRADSGFCVPLLYPAEPLAIFASHMYFHMTCCIPWDTICLA